MISIIIPVYNVEEFLDQCISSVVQQTYNNLEIILIDDGSSDNSGKICDEWAKKDKRIKVIHKENGGLSDARNVGINLAKGEYISFIDSDDYILETYFEYLYNLIITTNSDLSVCRCKKVDEKGNQIARIKQKQFKDKLLTGNINCMRDFLCNYDIDTVAWGKLYRKSLFNTGIRYPVGRYHEDVWTTYKLIARCNKIIIGSEALYCYRQRNSSINHSFSHRRHLDAIEGKIKKYEYIKRNYPKFTLATQSSIISGLNHYVLDIAKNNNKDKEIHNYIRLLYKKHILGYIFTKHSFFNKIFALFTTINLKNMIKLLQFKIFNK